MKFKDLTTVQKLNPEKVNVFTADLLELFPKLLVEAEDKGADVAVVKSAKEGVFTAGLDIMAMYRKARVGFFAFVKMLKLYLPRYNSGY